MQCLSEMAMADSLIQKWLLRVAQEFVTICIRVQEFHHETGYTTRETENDNCWKQSFELIGSETEFPSDYA